MTIDASTLTAANASTLTAANASTSTAANASTETAIMLEAQKEEMSQVLEYLRSFVMESAGANLILDYSEVFISALAVIVVAFLAAVFIKAISGRLERGQRKWETAFFSTLSGPLVLLIYLVGFTYILEIFVSENQTRTIALSATIRHIGIIACLLMFSLRFIRKVEEEMIEGIAAGGKGLDATGTRMVARLIRISLVLAAGLTALSETGVSVSGILAFGGVSGLAVGLAAKDPLANFFGAVMISLDRPFVEGDEIRSPDRSVEGFVEHIGWRITRIRTYNGHALYLPNALFSTVIVENFTHMKLRYFDQVFGLRQEDMDKVGDISKDIKELLTQHEKVDNDYLNVIVRKFSAFTIDLAVEFYTTQVDYKSFTKVREEMLLAIVEIIYKHGAEMPYPIQHHILQRMPEGKNADVPPEPSANLS